MPNSQELDFPGLEIGEELTNKEIVKIFKCSQQGGMRRSKRTNSLVVISDHTKPFYVDGWRGPIFYYTGMGLTGDQDLNFMQNKTLRNSDTNGVNVFLFEVFKSKKYSYQGQLQLAGEPYTDIQPDYREMNRNVWMFPLKRVIEASGSEEETISAILSEDFEQEQQAKTRQARELSEQELIMKIKEIDEMPVAQKVVSTRYERNANIAELARRQADGNCQLCRNQAPFLNKENIPYLEVHHIDWLSRGGADTIENTVALCPNCHRRMHVLDLERDKEILRGSAILNGGV